MRRKNEQEANGNGTGHIKFRVIEIEVDGANDTLAEGIKALTLALSKSPVTTAGGSQRALPSTATKRTTTTAVADAEPPAESEIEEETAELPEEEAVETSTPARPKPKPAVPATPKVLSDIDLNTGKMSLKDYVAQKNPSDRYEKFSTIAVWYKENHSIDEVDDDRIYTAYRFLDWIPPNDVAQTLRNLKAGKKWFDKGDTKGGYKVNIVGLNKVHASFK
jgi:hypothetical protein